MMGVAGGSTKETPSSSSSSSSSPSSLHRLLVLSFLLLLLLLPSPQTVHAYNNGVAQTPPMGWNTWCTDDICGLLDYCFESVVKEVADAMVAQGLDKLGYQYVNLDDCWSDKERTQDGQLQANPIQFPSGMKGLADYLHGIGLKLGLYTCIGTQTCKRGRPGSFGYYEQDAQTLAEWGVDFVKTDNCHKPGVFTEQQLYTNFSRALNATGRPMLFSLCEWGVENVQAWGADVGQMYRIQMDHLPLWRSHTKAAGMGIGQGTVDIIEYIATLKPSSFVQQYGWMDPDFLETLFPLTMSFTDSKTEFSFWALWSAPMLIATDLRNLTDNKAFIITNPEVIAINQDALYTAGDRVVNNTDGSQVWYKDLYGGDKAVLLFNSADFATLQIKVTWDMIGWQQSQAVSVRDLWLTKNMGKFQNGYVATVAPHDVFYFRASLVQ